MKSACEWCKEHWKLIATIVIVAVAVVLICTGVAAGAGAMLLGACWGAILGACIGGVAGGINSKMHGGSFLDGFEDGAFSGAITGGIMGGIMGGAQFKLTIRNIEKSGLTFENGKVEGKIPLDKYLKYRKMSVNNPDSDTMTLGKYEPTIRPDGTPDYSIPGSGAYTQKAGDTTYFSLGTEWDNITNTYNLDTAGKDMFKLFNQPALDDAVNAGKTIRFSHDPTAYGDCALK